MSAPDAGLSRQAMRLYQQGQFAQAEPLLQRLVGQDPENWQYPLMLGLCRQRQGDVAGALHWLRRAVKIGDGQTSTHYQLGRALAESGDASGAREQFGQVNALDPNHIEARTAMAQVSLMRGQFERAASEFKVALRASENHLPAMTGLAQARMELGQNEEAWSLLEAVLGRDAGHPGALSLMSRILVATGQFESAEKNLARALERAPEDAGSRSLLGSLLARRGQHGAALEQYRKALEGGAASPELILQVVGSLRQLGEVSQARRLLDDAAARWPEDLAIGLMRAELAAAAGESSRAMALLDTLDPEQPEVALTRARLKHNAGETQTAAALLEPLIDVEQTRIADQARMLLTMARARLNPDDLETARAPILPMLERNPPDADAQLNWAAVCDRHGHYAEARETLESLLSRTTEGSQDARLIQTALGNVLDRMDETEQAWAHWQAGGWRDIPIAARLNQQVRVLQSWLDSGRLPDTSRPFEDVRPAPVILAGWPGSGRAPMLAGLAAHPDVEVLDAAGEERRLEVLGIPAGPAELSALNHESLLLVRKRFLRGTGRTFDASVLLEPGWLSMAMLPALLMAFPDARIVLPCADVGDMRIQWLNDGYVQVDALVSEFEREQELLELIREQMAPQLIEIERKRLVESPAEAFTELCDALGLAHDATAEQAVMAQFDVMRFVPAGSGQRYRCFVEQKVDVKGQA